MWLPSWPGCATESSDGEVSWARLGAALPGVAPDSLRTSLRRLTEQDMLVQPALDRWRFASLLFQQWLAANAYAVNTTPGIVR